MPRRFPNHDVLLAGFPCQPFSIAGISKRNALSVAHGFSCVTQGTLFFDVARIIAANRPKAFLLENVRNLIHHAGGETFRTILRTLQEELGYEVHWKLLNGQHWVPQNRERVYIVGFRDRSTFTWEDLQEPGEGPVLDTILHPEDGSEVTEEPYTSGRFGRVNGKYVLSDRLWSYLQAYAERHRRAGNGFGYGLVTSAMVARTLSARYHKDGSEILVARGSGKPPRRLTPRECARLMGFPDTFRIPVSDTQSYRQFGNSVVVPLVEEIARVVVSRLRIAAPKALRQGTSAR